MTSTREERDELNRTIKYMNSAQSKLREEVERLREENRRLRTFSNGIVDASDHSMDVDGGTIQDLAVKYGLFDVVTVTAPCGDNCHCVEFHGEDGMSEGVKCYRKSAALAQPSDGEGSDAARDVADAIDPDASDGAHEGIVEFLRESGIVPDAQPTCPGCGRSVFPGSIRCPFCTAALPGDAAPRAEPHDWQTGLVKSHPHWTTCRKCGIIQRQDGQNKPCRGVVSVRPRAEACPRCGSPDPRKHPAVQFEGEVHECPDPFHRAAEGKR